MALYIHKDTFKPNFNIVDDAESHERYLIDKHSQKHDFQLEFYLNDEYYIGIKVIENNNHYGLVQVFKNITVCSCQQYHNHKLGYCKHISIVDSIFNNPRKLGLDRSQRMDFNKILSLKKKLSSHPKKTFHIYDSLHEKVLIYGDKSQDIFEQSVSLKTYIDHQKSIGTHTKNDLIINRDLELSGIKLYDYQNDILQKMIRNKRCICSMSMGEGKTLTSIFGLYFLGIKKLLIIAPKSVIPQWIKEIKKVLNKDVILLNRNKNIIGNDEFGITTYQYFLRNKDEISSEYDMVIADEIQFVRNNESKIWHAFKGLKSEYFWGLSGTPIENRLDDLYNIIDIIYPNYFPPKWKFDSQYRNLLSIHRTSIIYSSEIANLDKLKDNLKDIIFSHNKLDLQIVNNEYEWIDFEGAARRIHDTNMTNANWLLSKSLNSPLTFSEKAILQSYLLKARQSCNTIELIHKDEEIDSSKIKVIIDKIHSILPEKIVIYSEWTTMLKIIQRYIDVEYVIFDGSLSTKKRSSIIEKFRNDPSCKIFLSSDASGIGVDGLQYASNNMIHIELPWDPAKLDQRIGRLHRIGQTKQVNVYHFVMKDSIEENIYYLLNSKRKIRNDVLV